MIEDIHLLLNVMLLGFTLCFSLMASLYLLLSPRVILSDNPRPYQTVRRDAGWFVTVLTGGQMLAYIGWLASYQERIDNPYSSLISVIVLLPLLFKLLIHLLQNRKLQWWKILMTMVPFALTAIVYLLTNDIRWYYASEVLTILTLLAFGIWYFFAVRRYSQWLCDNFADLEHKETWWSFIMIAIVLLFFISYCISGGSFILLYILRFMIVIFVGFVTWRSDDVQDLQSAVTPVLPISTTDSAITPDFTKQLDRLARDTQFYLQYDLTLQQLAQQLGTNRTYLSRYFTAQGTTYNNYINHLRVEHFIELYQAEAKKVSTLPSVKSLAMQSGYSNYTTFYLAFKRAKGMNVSQWQTDNKQTAN